MPVDPEHPSQILKAHNEEVEQIAKKLAGLDGEAHDGCPTCRAMKRTE